MIVLTVRGQKNWKIVVLSGLWEDELSSKEIIRKGERGYNDKLSQDRGNKEYIIVEKKSGVG